MQRSIEWTWTRQWMRLLRAAALCGTLAVAGCTAASASGGFSNSGQAIMIVIARQPVYAQPNCTQANGTVLQPGSNVIDVGTMGTNCEEIVYVTHGSYSGLGYLPIYGMRRAAGGVRCVADVDCHLRAGPGATFKAVGALAPGASARGYGTTTTNAIITDGTNYDWWEVIDPASGNRADIYGANCQAF
jgi:hypothetical protein